MQGIEYFQLFNRYVGGDTIQFKIGDNVKSNLSDDNYSCWTLKQEILRVFIDCFIGSDNYVLDDAGPTTGYNGKTLLSVRDNLKLKRDLILNIKDVGGFIDKLKLNELAYCGLNKAFLERHQIDWHRDWQEIVRRLILIIEELIRIVEYCIENDKTLWVFPV